MKRGIIFGTIAISIAAVILVQWSNIVSAAVSNQSIAIPAYKYPDANDTFWKTMANAGGSKVPIVIANVNSGPDVVLKEDYKNAITKAKASGSKIIGYVRTGYETRSLDTITSEIDRWYSFYGRENIDGIFFDEISNRYVTNQDKLCYLANAYNYVKSKYGGFVIANPGSEISDEMAPYADVFVTAEYDLNKYINGYQTPKSEFERNPANQNRIMHMVYEVKSGDLDNVLRLSRERNAGYVYITDDDSSNPYDALPSYFSKLTDDVKKLPATVAPNEPVKSYPAGCSDKVGAGNQTPPAPNTPAQLTISGTPEVGKTLTANVSDKDGTTNSTIRYQWLANGVNISGATSKTYTLTAAEVGKKISVKVNYTDNRQFTEDVTSTETAPVVNSQTPANPNNPPVNPPEDPVTINLTGVREVKEGERARYRAELDLSPVGKADSTSMLLNNLWSLRGKGILFGQQHAIDESVSGTDAHGRKSDVSSMIGKYPAVFGFDSDEEPVDHSKSPSENGKALARSFIEADSLGSLVTISSHLKNPVSGGDAFDTGTKVDINRLLPNGDLNGKITSWLDTIAIAAQESVRTDGSKIPIIFRPLHENTGDWFWWGKGRMSTEDFKKFWQYIHNYLTKEKKVDNVLFAFSPNGHLGGNKDAYLATYPGDQYVDIMGYDAYQSDNSQPDSEWVSETVKDLATLNKLAVERNKIAAFTEFGLNNDRVIQRSGNANTRFFSNLITAIKANPDAAKIAYMMTWANWGVDENGKFQSYTPWPGHEMEGDFKEFAKQLLFSKAAARDVSVDVEVEYVNTDSSDIRVSTQRVIIPKGQNRANFTIEALVDGKVEGDETYRVRIRNAQGANIGTGDITTVIRDGDTTNPNPPTNPPTDPTTPPVNPPTDPTTPPNPPNPSDPPVNPPANPNPPVNPPATPSNPADSTSPNSGVSNSGSSQVTPAENPAAHAADRANNGAIAQQGAEHQLADTGESVSNIALLSVIVLSASGVLVAIRRIL